MTTQSSQALTLNFHGTDLFIVEHNGQPYTPMKQIVEGMGLDWSGQLAKLNSNPLRWAIVKITIPTLGDTQEAICMPLRKLFGWLSGIYPNKVKLELRDRIIQYQNECDNALWDYWQSKRQAQFDLKALPEPPTITKAQQGELYTRATRIAGGDKKKMTAIWSRLRTHYRINGYTNLPADQFQDALETLDRYKQEYNQGAEILHISTIELEAMLTERAQALPPPAKEGELLPNPTKDNLIGILTRQITALEAQLQAAQNLSPARMILALKQEGHLVIEKGQDLPGQIVMHYVSPKRLTQLIHCATDRLENFLREEVANA